MTKNIKFKKNESFYIREGWFEKAINSIAESNSKNIFAKNDGVKILGIGTNMVKSLRYWLVAADVIDSSATKTTLTKFGKLLYKYDQYLEDNFSWFLIHYNLVKNKIECPIFNHVFHSNMKTFRKADICNELYEELQKEGVETKKEYIEDDINVFLKSYFTDELINNPEDNYVCPLTSLKLISKQKDKYTKINPAFKSLSYLIVYYVLSDIYQNKAFTIEDSLVAENSPVKIFCLDKNAYIQYLEEMKKSGLININKTAGLNTVYFEDKLSLEDIFKNYKGGR